MTPRITSPLHCILAKRVMQGLLLVFSIAAAQAVTINTVYFGQTHVLKADNPYFGLVGEREALIKVHVTDPATPASPCGLGDAEFGRADAGFAAHGAGDFAGFDPGWVGRGAAFLREYFHRNHACCVGENGAASDGECGQRDDDDHEYESGCAHAGCYDDVRCAVFRGHE